MAEEYEEGVIEGNQPPFNNQYQESVGEEGKKEENYFLNVLFVSRYRYSNTTENHIREAFEQFGPIKDIFVKTNFSFVEFVNPEDAHKAKHSMHHHPGLGSDSLIVDFKKDGVPKHKSQDSKYHDRPRSGGNREHRGGRDGPSHQGDNYRGSNKPYFPPPDLEPPRYPPSGPRDGFPPKERYDGPPPGRGPPYPSRSPPRMQPPMDYPRSDRGPLPHHDRPPFDGGRNFVPGDFHPRNGPGMPPPYPVDDGYYRKDPPPFRDGRNGPPPPNDHFQGGRPSYPPRDRSNSPPRGPPLSYRDGPPPGGNRGGGYDNNNYGPPPPGSRSPPLSRSPPRGHSPPRHHNLHNNNGNNNNNLHNNPMGKRPYENMNDNNYGGGGGGGGSRDGYMVSNNRPGPGPYDDRNDRNRYANTRQPSPPMMHAPRGPPGDYHHPPPHHMPPGRGGPSGPGGPPPGAYPPSLGPPADNFKRPRY